MSKTYDVMMKLLDEKGVIPDDEAAKLIKEHGPLHEEEKKKIAAAIKMAEVLNKGDITDKEKDKALKKANEDKDAKKADGDKETGDEGEDKDEKKDKPSGDEATMDDYLLALSVLDSEAASKEDKEKAQKVKDKFESQ